jgi:predicted Zn-dependent protease
MVTRYHAAVLLTYFGQFEAAQNALRRFCQDNNRSMPILELLGLNALRMSLFPSDVPPEKRELVIMAGRASYESYRFEFDHADWHFRQLVARYPEVPNVHYAYGIFLMRDRPELGLEEFLRELEISPNHVAALSQVSFECLNRGEPERGLLYAQRAVELDPESYAARNALGRILLETGDTKGAIDHLLEGIRLNSESPEMHFALAQAYTRAGRREDALRERKIFQKLAEKKQQILEGLDETKELLRKTPR